MHHRAISKSWNSCIFQGQQNVSVVQQGKGFYKDAIKSINYNKKWQIYFIKWKTSVHQETWFRKVNASYNVRKIIHSTYIWQQMYKKNNLYQTVYRSLNHKDQKLETTQTSISIQMNKPLVVSSYVEMIPVDKEEGGLERCFRGWELSLPLQGTYIWLSAPPRSVHMQSPATSDPGHLTTSSGIQGHVHTCDIHSYRRRNIDAHKKKTKRNKEKATDRTWMNLKYLMLRKSIMARKSVNYSYTHMLSRIAS